MKIINLQRKVLVGVLTILGFSACTTEEPDLYGTPLLYGPLPPDSTYYRGNENVNVNGNDNENGNYNENDNGNENTNEST